MLTCVISYTKSVVVPIGHQPCEGARRPTSAGIGSSSAPRPRKQWTRLFVVCLRMLFANRCCYLEICPVYEMTFFNSLSTFPLGCSAMIMICRVKTAFELPTLSVTHHRKWLWFECGLFVCQDLKVWQPLKFLWGGRGSDKWDAKYNFKSLRGFSLTAMKLINLFAKLLNYFFKRLVRMISKLHRFLLNQ